MSDIRKVMNEEIRRLAKKEIKAALAPVLATNSALKKRVAEQEKRIRQLEAHAAVPAAAQISAAASGKAENGKEKKIRLTPDRIRKIRAKLGISQAQFAKILGVNTQSVNFWENGKTTPRSVLKKEMAAIRDMGKREIAKLFAEKEIVAKKAEKAVRSAVKAVRTARRKVLAAAAAPTARKAAGRKAKKPLQATAAAPAAVSAEVREVRTAPAAKAPAAGAKLLQK